MKKVFIGVGHGGRDPGALGGGLRESDVNLATALAMGEELRRNGVKVLLSRLADEDDPLEEEIQEANSFAPDLAIDVHNNAGGGDGFEAYVQTNGYREVSRAFGEALEQEVRALGQNSRGIKTRTYQGGDYYGFLRRVKAPAVLCEGVFLDSKDRKAVDTLEKQRAFGAAYARAALEVLGVCERSEGPGKDLELPPPAGGGDGIPWAENGDEPRPPKSWVSQGEYDALRLECARLEEARKVSDARVKELEGKIEAARAALG